MKATPYRRHVIIDVASIDLDQQTSTQSKPGKRRIVWIAMFIDDGEGAVKEFSLTDFDEKELLMAFWTLIRPGDLFIGRQEVDTSLFFIRLQSWAHGISPESEYELRVFFSHETFDVGQVAAQRGFKLRPSKTPKSCSAAIRVAFANFQQLTCQSWKRVPR